MFITRRIGTLIRGKATPFQLYAASLLGALLGFLPGFQQAPALTLLWVFLLLILNANIFLAGVVTLISKLVFLITMPLLFELGRFLLEGPTQGLFAAIVNAPVGAYSGLDYYVVAGGQLVAVVLGIVVGSLATQALFAYRRKMRDLSEKSDRLKTYSSKPWVKAFKFIFLGSGRGKDSYEAIMARRIGNPIRIWGLGLVLILVAVLAIGLRSLSEPLLTSMAKRSLEAANGATVDLESAQLSLGEGRVEIQGLAMTDPQSLGTNLFQARRVTADLNTADLLRKRFSIDLLTVEEGATATTRETPGELIGPSPDERPGFQMPDFEDLESVLREGELWKQRLSQAKRWLEKLGSAKGPGREQMAAWEQELDSRIRSLGHAHVKADFLTEESPTVWIRRVEAMGVATPYLDNAIVDIVAADVSTHPHLARAAPTFSIVSRDDRLDARLSLAGASNTGSNNADIRLKGYPVDQAAAALRSEGRPPISGGTMDIALTGRIGAVDNDLVAQVRFAGATGRVAGTEVNLDGISLPIQVRGPLDNPGVKLESKALERLLVDAGKQRLLDRVTQELDRKAPAEEGSEGGERKPKDALKDILRRNLGQ